MADFVGAVDQGTTSTRFMIFDHAGNEVGQHQLEHEQILPRAGWVEHDPVEIWERTAPVIQTALDERRTSAPSDLAAIGITNQRETTVVWNRSTGRPYYNAIVWQDTRTDRIAAALDRDGRGDVIRRKAGLPPATYFSGGKIQWILENVDGVRAAAERGDAIFGTTDTLADLEPDRRRRRRRRTSPTSTNASRTMLMNLETLDWDDELLGVLRHPARDAARDPAVVRPERRTARSRPRPRSAGVPLTGDLGDQQAATVGQVCFAPGEAKNTYGTGNFLLLNTGDRARPQSSTGCSRTVCYQFGDEPAGVRAGGLDRGHRLGGAVAARPARHHLRRRRDRGAGRVGAGQRRRLLRARRSPGCSRRTGAATPAARSSGCPASTPTRTWPGPRWRRSATRAATSSTRWSRTPACTLEVLKVDGGVTANDAVHAAPGRHPRRAGQPAGRRRDDRARRGLRGRPGRRVLGGHRRAAGQLARGPSAGTRPGPTSSARDGYAGWKKAVERTLDWVDGRLTPVRIG